MIEIPAFTVGEVAPLFDNLPAPQASKEIKPMEQFDQGWGTILYRTTLPAVKEGTTLLIDEVHDWAQVFADGNCWAVWIVAEVKTRWCCRLWQQERAWISW